jgi:hypothetical protein
VAVAKISSINTNRCTRPRLALSLTVLLEILAINLLPLMASWIGFRFSPDWREIMAVSGVAGSIVFSIGALFISDTPFDPPRRVCLSWPRRQLYPAFFYPGFERYCSYLLLHFAVFAGLALPEFLDTSSYHEEMFGIVISLFTIYVTGMFAYTFARDWAIQRNWRYSPLIAMLSFHCGWIVLAILLFICCSVATGRNSDWALYLHPILALGELNHDDAYVLPGIVGVCGIIWFLILTLRGWGEGRVMYQERIEEEQEIEYPTQNTELPSSPGPKTGE